MRRVRALWLALCAALLGVVTAPPCAVLVAAAGGDERAGLGSFIVYEATLWTAGLGVAWLALRLGWLSGLRGAVLVLAAPAVADGLLALAWLRLPPAMSGWSRAGVSAGLACAGLCALIAWQRRARHSRAASISSGPLAPGM